MSQLILQHLAKERVHQDLHNFSVGLIGTLTSFLSPRFDKLLEDASLFEGPHTFHTCEADPQFAKLLGMLDVNALDSMAQIGHKLLPTDHVLGDRSSSGLHRQSFDLLDKALSLGELIPGNAAGDARSKVYLVVKFLRDFKAYDDHITAIIFRLVVVKQTVELPKPLFLRHGIEPGLASIVAHRQGLCHTIWVKTIHILVDNPGVRKARVVILTQRIVSLGEGREHA